VVAVVVRLANLAAPTAALLTFTFRSLARNRRHLLIVVTYAGLGLAIGLTRPISVGIRGLWTSDRADAALLTAPLVLMLTLVVGLRRAFKVPTEIEANWPFRLSPPSVRQASGATRLALVVLAVVPVVAGFGIATSMVGWPLDDVLFAMLFDLALGMLLVEWAVREWTTIPFACAHVPAPSTVRSRWLAFVAFLVVFAFMGANLQEAALRSTSGRLLYLGVATILTATFYLLYARRARRLTLQFDEEPEDQLSTLGLSEALR
jgi:hypothetical protein